jgi:septal ring factor EnvC (AmiA/AmiB activator)
MQTRIRHTLAVMSGILLAALLLFSAAATAQTDQPQSANEQGSDKVSQLLQQARDKAATLATDADDMESLTRSDVSWQTHADTLNRIKQHINDLGRLLDQLQNERASAAPWQQQAIDRMTPLMKELAAHTTAAMNLLNQNRTRPTSAEYTDFLKVNDDTAHQLANLVSSYLQYGQTLARLEKLQQRVEVATR